MKTPIITNGKSIKPIKKLSIAALADHIAFVWTQKKQITDLWEQARKAALATRRKKFNSGEWEIVVQEGSEAQKWDNEKLEAYFLENNIDPTDFKMAYDTGARILVKRLAP